MIFDSVPVYITVAVVRLTLAIAGMLYQLRVAIPDAIHDYQAIINDGRNGSALAVTSGTQRQEYVRLIQHLLFSVGPISIICFFVFFATTGPPIGLQGYILGSIGQFAIQLSILYLTFNERAMRRRVLIAEYTKHKYSSTSTSSTSPNPSEESSDAI